MQTERREESDSSSALSSPSGSELISLGDSSFTPIYAMGVRENPADLEKRRVSLAILLNYGTVSIGDISINVVDSGEILQYTVFWPIPMTDTDVLHTKWINGKKGIEKIEPYHPQVKSVRSAIERLKRNTTGRVHSTARIHLPFACETRFETHFLNFKEYNVKVLYIILQAPPNQARITSSAPIEFDDL